MTSNPNHPEVYVSKFPEGFKLLIKCYGTCTPLGPRVTKGGSPPAFKPLYYFLKEAMEAAEKWQEYLDATRKEKKCKSRS